MRGGGYDVQGRARRTEAPTGFWSDLVLSVVSSIALAAVLIMALAEPIGALPSSGVTAPAIGKVTQRLREVRRRAEGALVWNDARTQEPVYARDVIYVGPDSSAVVTLDDGSQIDIDQASLVVIGQGAAEAVESVGPVEVQVVHGAATGRAGARHMALRSGEVSARLGAGTAVGMRVREGTGTEVAVKRGKATLATAAGSVTLAEGEARGIADGRAAVALPEPEIRLLAPASDARFLSRGSDAALELMWESAPGRGSYAVDVAKDTEFKQVVERKRVERPGVSIKGLAEGVFYWRVERSAKKATSRSETRRVVVIRDEPPVIFRPRGEGLIDLSDRPVLSLAWSEVSGVTGYRVELARGLSFATPLYSVRTAAASLLLRADEVKLEEGRHCLRVKVDDPGRPETAWSQAVCFRLVTRPVLRAPELYDPLREGGGPKSEDKAPAHGFLFWMIGSVAQAAEPAAKPIVLRWERLSGAVGYVIEVASDREFTQIVVSDRTTDNFYRFAPPSRRQYLWRVRGVDADGREGKVSVPKTVGVEVPGPAALEPVSGFKIEAGSAAPIVRLRWEEVSGAVGYGVDIAADDGFSVAEHLTTTATSLEYKAKRVGPFFWRVVASLLEGEHSLPGSVLTFSIVPVPPVPTTPVNGEAISKSGPEVGVRMQWSKRLVDRYEVEVARDEGFGQRLKQVTSGAASITVKLEGEGECFWRVRTLAPIASAWGPSASFTLLPAALAVTTPEPDGVIAVVPPRDELPRDFEVPEPPLSIDHLLIGGSLGFLYNLGEVSTLRGSAEVAYVRWPLLPFELGGLARVGYYTDAEGFADVATGIEVKSRIHAFPIELLAIAVLPTAYVETLFGVGLCMNVTYGTMNVSGQPQVREVFVDWGALLTAGVSRDLGFGALFAELSFALSSQSRGQIEVSPGGLLAAVGYRWRLW